MLELYTATFAELYTFHFWWFMDQRQGDRGTQKAKLEVVFLTVCIQWVQTLFGYYMHEWK